MDQLFKNIKRENTSCHKWDLREEKFGKNTILPFWIADSDYETCPEVKQTILKRAQEAAFGYTFASSQYFEIFHDWCKKHYGYDANRENTVLTTGVVNALYFIVNFFSKEGDSVLVNPPVYNPFYNVIQDNQRNTIYSPLIRKEINDDLFTYEFDFQDLEEKIKKAKIYILCNPHNPVGRCYRYDELEKIVLLCKKYNCLLVSDEIHCDIIMKGYQFTSVGTFFKDYENIILCTAPSKTFNVAGLANSNIIFNNKQMVKEFKERYEHMSIESNVFGLVATEAAYKYGEYWVEKQNEHLSNQAKKVYEFCIKNHFKVCLLEGTYLMWIDMSRLGLDQETLFNKLIENDVWINNGTIYCDQCVGYIRINVACDSVQLEKGLSFIEKMIESL